MLQHVVIRTSVRSQDNIQLLGQGVHQYKTICRKLSHDCCVLGLGVGQTSHCHVAVAHRLDFEHASISARRREKEVGEHQRD